ncbi:MAG: flagellar hook-length control protein FliK [Nitrosomonas sp.]|jgi:flagellar hook-length control protein FliK|nr:flagellar hook-length control protein FliK [Nitrosomonas sp.]
MLDPVVSMQVQAQAPQPLKGNDGPGNANKSESEGFDNILAREVAEKEPAPAESSVKKVTSDANSKQTESVSDPSVEQPGDAGKASMNQLTGVATSATDSAMSADSMNYSTSESTVNQIQFFQALIPENSIGTEVIPSAQPIVSTGNFTPPKIQSGLIASIADAMPDSDSITATITQPVHPGVQEDFIQNFAGSGPNDLRPMARAVNFVDDAALPAFSSGFQKHLFTRAGEVNLSLQAGVDMLQTHDLLSLNDVTQAVEASPLLQTGVDMPEFHSQSASGGLPQATSSAALQTTTATAAPLHVNLDMQMDQPKWGNEFSQKIVWLAHQQHQVAELRLNPAHLGPVEIMLSLSGDNGAQASAQFVSPHLAVREAIEAALPRLREMMAENGIQLGDVTVGAESFQRQEQGERQGHQHARNVHGVNGFNARDELNPGLEGQLTLNRHSGIVNTFA